MTSFRGILQLLQSIFVLGTTAYYLFCKPNTSPAVSYLNITSHLSEHLFLGHPEVELQVPQILTERKKKSSLEHGKITVPCYRKRRKICLGIHLRSSGWKAPHTAQPPPMSRTAQSDQLWLHPPDKSEV